MSIPIIELTFITGNAALVNLALSWLLVWIGLALISYGLIYTNISTERSIQRKASWYGTGGLVLVVATAFFGAYIVLGVIILSLIIQMILVAID